MLNRKNVRLFDVEKGTLTSIPAAELAPGYILAEGPGIGGPAYVEVSKLLLSSEPVHSCIPPEAERALKYYCDSVAEVDVLSLAEHQFWLKCNHHPVRELTILCHIARIFRQFTKAKVISSLARRELFLLLQLCSMAEKKTILQIHQPGPALSERLVGPVVDAYYSVDPRKEFARMFDVLKMHFA